MAVQAPSDLEAAGVQVRHGARRDHLRLLPSPAGDMAARAVLLLFLLFAAMAWIIEQARALEEEREDQIDVEEARKALAEEGSISLADLKAELGP